MGRGRMRRGTDLGFAGSRNKSEESRAGAARLGKDFRAQWTREKGKDSRAGHNRERRRRIWAPRDGEKERALRAERIRVRAKSPEE